MKCNCEEKQIQAIRFTLSLKLRKRCRDGIDFAQLYLLMVSHQLIRPRRTGKFISKQIFKLFFVIYSIISYKQPDDTYLDDILLKHNKA